MNKKLQWLAPGVAALLSLAITLGVAADGSTVYLLMVLVSRHSTAIPTLTQTLTATDTATPTPTQTPTKTVNLTLDSSSTWTVTADSYLTCLTDPDGISGTTVTNITGNGHTIYYNVSACTALSGQTYMLNGGGYLRPSA
jgi:hypothetical protein